MTEAMTFKLAPIVSRLGAVRDIRLTARLEFKLPVICVIPDKLMSPVRSERMRSPDMIRQEAISSASDWLLIVAPLHASRYES